MTVAHASDTEAQGFNPSTATYEHPFNYQRIRDIGFITAMRPVTCDLTHVTRDMLPGSTRARDPVRTGERHFEQGRLTAARVSGGYRFFHPGLPHEGLFIADEHGDRTFGVAGIVIQ